MIRYITVFRRDKNLGLAYNEEMAALENDDDWCCFIDGDAMFTTSFFGNQIEDTIKDNPEYKLFTAMVNRVGTSYQCVEGMWEEDGMKAHFDKGQEIWDTYGTSCKDITFNTPISGTLILLQKGEWKRVKGFVESGKALGVDNSIHYAVKNNWGKIGLMQGIYLMHYYRNGDIAYKQHLL